MFTDGEALVLLKGVKLSMLTVSRTPGLVSDGFIDVCGQAIQVAVRKVRRSVATALI